jgi:hypothetical protein
MNADKQPRKASWKRTTDRALASAFMSVYQRSKKEPCNQRSSVSISGSKKEPWHQRLSVSISG